MPIVIRVDSGDGFPVPPASKTLLNGNPISKKMGSIIQAAIQGTNRGMDPKGDCYECTYEEIRKAVEYVLSVVESR